MLKKINGCRICGNQELVSVIDLGEQILASNFELDANYPVSKRKLPLHLVRCSSHKGGECCGLVQLDHTCPGWVMYSSYGYQSGINQTMTNHLQKLASNLISIIPDAKTIVDIGANDGTLLSGYNVDNEVKLIAFEPSNIIPKVAGKEIKHIKEFFASEASDALSDGNKADIITSIAMFYDLDDPTKFVEDISKIISDRGIWCAEFSYMPHMIMRNSFDTICHEHLEYYHLLPLEFLLEKFGLRIFRIEFNDANGGSIRFYASKKSAVPLYQAEEDKKLIYQTKLKEFDEMFDTDLPYEKFRAEIKKTIASVTDYLKQERASGKIIYGYGASTKGNVILQACGIDHSILSGIADRNPRKWGGKLAFGDIPIVSEDEMRAAEPDILFVLPWHFKQEFLTREKEFIDRGGKMVFPLPTLEIVSNQ